MTTKPKVLIYDIEPYYKLEIGEDIKIRSFSNHMKGKELKQWVGHFGYLQVSINKRSVLLHRVIAEAVYGKSDLTVNHIDGNKLNNHPDNLEYCTIAEQIEHSMRMGLHVSHHPERHGKYKDGRATKDKLAEYKHQHYLDNMEAYKERGRLFYLKKKAEKENTDE